MEACDIGCPVAYDQVSFVSLKHWKDLVESYLCCDVPLENVDTLNRSHFLKINWNYTVILGTLLSRFVGLV